MDMRVFKTWEVVKVPFPYTDRPVQQRRPALVVGTGSIQDRHGLIWVMMITSSKNQAWPEDVSVSDLGKAGLPISSVVRTAKIATIEASTAEALGTLCIADREAVRKQISRILENIL